MGQYILSPNAR